MSKQTYPKIEVGLYRDARWYMTLRRKLEIAGIKVGRKAETRR